MAAEQKKVDFGEATGEDGEVVSRVIGLRSSKNRDRFFFFFFFLDDSLLKN